MDHIKDLMEAAVVDINELYGSLWQTLPGVRCNYFIATLSDNGLF